MVVRVKIPKLKTPKFTKFVPGGGVVRALIKQARLIQRQRSQKRRIERMKSKPEVETAAASQRIKLLSWEDFVSHLRNYFERNYRGRTLPLIMHLDNELRMEGALYLFDSLRPDIARDPNIRRRYQQCVEQNIRCISLASKLETVGTLDLAGVQPLPKIGEFVEPVKRTLEQIKEAQLEEKYGGLMHALQKFLDDVERDPRVYGSIVPRGMVTMLGKDVSYLLAVNLGYMDKVIFKGNPSAEEIIVLNLRVEDALDQLLSEIYGAEL